MGTPGVGAFGARASTSGLFFGEAKASRSFPRLLGVSAGSFLVVFIPEKGPSGGFVGFKISLWISAMVRSFGFWGAVQMLLKGSAVCGAAGSGRGCSTSAEELPFPALEYVLVLLGVEALDSPAEEPPVDAGVVGELSKVEGAAGEGEAVGEVPDPRRIVLSLVT